MCHSSPVNVVKVVIFAIPVYIRIMQCLRQRRDALIRHKLQQENDPRKPGAGKLRVVKVKPSSALAGKRGASGRVATDSGSGRSSGIGGSGGDNDGVVTLFGDDAPADSDVRDLEENAPLERKEDDEQDEQDERDEPDEPDEPFERPKLSRSESVDMPLPTVFQMLCPDTSYSLVPEVVRKCWNTIWVWPYSFNALKYFLGLCVIIFGAFPPQDPLSTAYMSWYIPLMAISSLYASYWDIANDFQLMQLSSTRPLLRDKLLYEGNERFYYFVMVVDPALRFLWTLSFTPYGGHPFYVLFEIVRRSLWACLRMEIGYIQELARRR